jgi:hypothetical protein
LGEAFIPIRDHELPVLRDHRIVQIDATAYELLKLCFFSSEKRAQQRDPRRPGRGRFLIGGLTLEQVRLLVEGQRVQRGQLFVSSL